MQLPYSDTHTDIPTDYLWHSTVRGHSYNSQYSLWGYCTFKVNVGGKSGTATVSFRFNYSIFRSSTDPRSVELGSPAYEHVIEGEPYGSDLHFDWDHAQ